jgi:RNA polymerase sigma-70 factor, ECF subfamily
MEDLTTSELVLLCKERLPDDTQAFESIVARFKRKVFGTAYRLLRNRDDAEEQAQEVFLKAFRGIVNLKEPATFEAWLHRITINTCLGALEKRKRVPTVLVNSGTTAGEDVFYDAASESDTARTFENREALTCLKKALSKLDSNGRGAVILRDVEELSYEEIADLLKIGLSAVKMRIHRARLAIQKLIEEICPGVWRPRSG